MQLLSVDDNGHAFDNPRMAKDERKHVGSRLRALRAEKGWTQKQAARKAKIAVGTLQSIESGKREARESSLDQLARIYGKTFEELRRENTPIMSTDARINGLSNEDFQIARLFHDASTAIRLRVSAILQSGEMSDEHIIRAIVDRRSAAPTPPKMSPEELAQAKQQQMGGRK
jgi:transcriptional regulator with XRE-family HTH domain